VRVTPASYRRRTDRRRIREPDLSALQPITSTCEPRKDVLSGSLSDEHFAADLDHIVRDPDSYPVYGKPDEFFALTHPTKGLRDLLTRTFGRLSGAKGIAGTEHGVLRPQTVFGGGKTHGLIALYHLATGARPPEIDRFVDPALLPAHSQVAAAVGDKFNPVDGISTRVGGSKDVVKTLTLWGDIAAQLGSTAWEAMKGADAARTAPGSETWAKAIGSQPTIIIIDEIAQHIRQCATSGDEDVRRQAQAIPVFLKSLFQHAAASPNVVVVVSLATHADAYGRETTELEKILDEHLEAAEDAASDAQSILARQQTIIRPAEDAEIAEILKTRLFSSIDASAAGAAAIAYRDLYEQLHATGIALPDGADSPAAYADRLRNAYPFHPELVRVLDKRIGTIPSFQRARGALRLLAEVIAALWNEGTDAQRGGRRTPRGQRAHQPDRGLGQGRVRARRPRRHHGQR
jgi:predicted AAA+ superfamily ATPase